MPVRARAVDNIKAIHDAVGQEYDLGTIDQFRNAMLKPDQRKALFDAVGQEYDFGDDFDKFDKAIVSSFPEGIPYAQPELSPVMPTTSTSVLPKVLAPGQNTAATKTEAKLNQEDAIRRGLLNTGYWESAGTMVSDFVRNTGPQSLASLQLMGVTTKYDEFVDQVNMGARGDDHLFGNRQFKLTEQDFIKTPEEVYSYIDSKKPLAKRFSKELAETKAAYPQGGKEAFNHFKELIGKSQVEKIGGLIQEIDKQKGESQAMTGRVVKSYKDVDSFSDLLSYAGGLTGQGVATSSTVVLGSGVGAFMLETAGAYEENVEGMMQATGKTREEVENSPEMKKKMRDAAIAVGAVNSVLEKVGFGESSKPLKNLVLDILSKKVMTRKILAGTGEWVAGTFTEGFTEALQEANTQYMAAIQLGKTPEEALKLIDVERLIDSGIGGAVSAGTMGAVSPIVRAGIKTALTKKTPPAATAPPAAPAAAAPTAKPKGQKKPGKAPPAPPAPAPKGGFVQGTIKISEDPLTTATDVDGSTVQTFDSGLKDNNGEQITIETVTDQEGNVINQALNGAVVGSTREDVAQQLVDATQRPVAEGDYVDYGGITGKLIRDEDNNLVVHTSDGDFVMVEGGLSGKPLTELGLTVVKEPPAPPKEFDNEKTDINSPIPDNELHYDFETGMVTMYGNEYKYDGVETDEKGVTTAIRVVDKKGNTKFVRNQDAIYEIEIQKMLSEEPVSGEQITKAAEELKITKKNEAKNEQSGTTTEPVQQGGSVENTTQNQGDKTSTGKPEGKQKVKAPKKPKPSPPTGGATVAEKVSKKVKALGKKTSDALAGAGKKVAESIDKLANSSLAKRNAEWDAFKKDFADPTEMRGFGKWLADKKEAMGYYGSALGYSSKLHAESKPAFDALVGEYRNQQKSKKDAVQKQKTATVPVVKTPGDSKPVVEGTSESGNQKAPDAGKEKTEKVKDAKVDYTNVPKRQQSAVKNKAGSGWVVSGKKNLKSPDGTKIVPIIEMKKGGEKIYVNPKGDHFTNIADALDKSQDKPAVKGKKVTPAKKTTTPVVEQQTTKQEPVKQEPAKQESTKKEPKNPEPAKQEPAKKSGTQREPVPVSEESQDVLDFLSGEMFPETIADFIEAVQDIVGYAGKSGSVKARARLDQMVAEGLITIDGKKITPTFEKQGNEYAPQTVEEYAPENPNDLAKANRRRSAPYGLQFVGPKWVTDVDVWQMVKKGAGKIWNQLSHRGKISDPIFAAKNKEDFINNQYQARAIATANKLIAIVKKKYNGKITEAQVTEINLALQGKTTTPNGVAIVLPLEVMRVVNDLRRQIDNMSRRMVRDGVVEGELAAKIMANLGVYAYRSYEKFDNVKWAEQVGQDTYNRAIDFLKQKYPGYDRLQINALVDYLLRSPEAPMSVIKGGSFGSMDLTALRRRKTDVELAPEIRALFGEYNDPVTNFTRSIGKMANMISKHLFQQEVYNAGIAEDRQAGQSVQDWLEDQTKKGKFLFKERIGQFTYQINSAGTGAPTNLNGLFTTKDNAEVLTIVNKTVSDENILLSVLKGLVSKVNYGFTILNLGTHVKNFGANPLFAIANGFFPTAEMGGIFSKGKKGAVRSEADLQIAEKQRAKLLETEKEVSRLRLQGMADLAAETAQTEKIKARQDKQTKLDARVVKAEQSLADAIAADKPEGVIATRKARVEIAKKKAKANARILKIEQDTLNGVFDAQKLADARTKLKTLIANGATQAELDRARDRIAALATREQKVQKFIDAQQRRTDLAKAEAQADNLRGGAGEYDELPSLLAEGSEWEVKMDRWKSYGLIDDSIVSGLLRDYWKRMEQDPLLARFNETIPDKLNRWKGNTLDGIEKVYQAGDWRWKVRAFELEAARYRKAIPTLTQQQAYDIAAEIVKDTRPTYSRAAPLIKTLKPLMGSFATFPAEVVRTFWNTMALAKKEIGSGNPVLRNIGIKRLAGMTVALTIPTAMSLTSRALLGLNDDDEEKFRQTLPEWSKNSTLLFLNKQGETDPFLTTTYDYMDLGTYDAYAVLKRPFTALMFTEKPISEAKWDALYQTMAPIVAPYVFVARGTEALQNRDQRGNLIGLATDEEWEGWRKRIAYVANATQPGVTKTYDRIRKAQIGETSTQGKRFMVGDEILAGLGFRKTKLDITYWAEIYVTANANRMITDARNARDKILRQTNTTPEEKMAALAAYVKANQRAIELIGRDYDAAVQLGADPMVMSQINWPRDMRYFWDYVPEEPEDE